MGQGMGPTSSQQASRWPELGRRLNPFVWTLIWILAVALAALVHLAFFVKWPDHFIHEDSAAYLSEAQSILTGHYVDDNGVRPYGVPFFLALLSKLFSPNILVFATAQHVLSIVSALLIAASIRLGGAPRIFALLVFLLASLYARTVHYDNTIGGETISVFLTSVAVFMAASAAFRGWPPLPFAVGIGVCLGTLMLCRSAAFGTAAVIILWTATMVSRRWIGRLGILTLIGGIVVGVYLTPTLINRIRTVPRRFPRCRSPWPIPAISITAFISIERSGHENSSTRSVQRRPAPDGPMPANTNGRWTSSR